MGEKKSELGFWAITGVFISLWGVQELGYALSLAANFWKASPKLLWGGFLLNIGAYLILKVIQAHAKRS